MIAGLLAVSVWECVGVRAWKPEMPVSEFLRDWSEDGLSIEYSDPELEEVADPGIASSSRPSWCC